jgi:hypothetical protein
MSNYEKLVFDTYKNKDSVVAALRVVRAFIIEKKLLLTGGMAIDMALKHTGSDGIYADETLPDYDFFSPEFHTHAYELGQKLCAAGMPNVSIINAVHVLTMRVRVNFDVVADITYMDPKIFSKIGRIVVADGVNVVHPYFIMSTQCISLSSPYSGYPREAIMQRWEKDMSRFDMLSAAFPVEPKQAKLVQHTVTLPKYSDFCVCGWAAISYWLGGMKIAYDAETRQLTYEGVGGECELLSAHIGKFVGDGVTYMNSYMDIIPRSIIIGDMKKPYIRIFDSYGIKYSAHKDPTSGLYIVSPFFLLAKSLVEILAEIDVEVNSFIYNLLYRTIKDIADGISETELHPMLPSPYTYGDHIVSMSYIAQLHQFLVETSSTIDSKRYSLPMSVNLDTSCIIPDNVRKFDISVSEFFHTDYCESTSFPLDHIQPPPLSSPDA